MSLSLAQKAAYEENERRRRWRLEGGPTLPGDTARLFDRDQNRIVTRDGSPILTALSPRTS
jgi:hypothetical protein